VRLKAICRMGRRHRHVEQAAQEFTLRLATHGAITAGMTRLELMIILAAKEPDRCTPR
jgi:hypothetical protein